MEISSWTIGALVGLVCYVWMKTSNDSSEKYPPSPRGIPILGHLLHLATISYESMTRMSDRLGGSYMLHIFNANFLFLTSWEDNKEAIVDRSDIFSTKLSSKDKQITAFNQKTFLYTNGPLWKEKRRFTLHHLKNFVFGKSSMEETILNELSRVCDVLDKHETMAFNKFFFRPFVNVIWGIVAGKTYDYDDKDLVKVSDAILSTFLHAKKGVIVSVLPILKHVPGDPFKVHLLVSNLLTVIDFIERNLDEHVASLSDGEPRDFMDAYLQQIQKRNGSPLKEETDCYERSHLVGGTYDILQAGVETTSTTLEWSLLYLALWPEVQKKIQDEMDEAIGTNRRPVYSDRTALPYVRATIMEIQRYCSVIPLCSPRTTTRATTLRHYTIPKGTVVFQNLFSVHHDKKLWGDPEIFRPERFLTANHKAEKLDGWIPFSLGPRICLGENLAQMELFLFITGLLHRYSFHCVSGKPLPSTVPVDGATLTPQPFKLVIRPRRM